MFQRRQHNQHDSARSLCLPDRVEQILQAALGDAQVVATGWSGNLDCMTPDNAILLPYRLVPVDDERFAIEGACWAEADEDAASAALQRLYAIQTSAPGSRVQGRIASKRILRGIRTIWPTTCEPGIGATRAPRRRSPARQAERHPDIVERERLMERHEVRLPRSPGEYERKARRNGRRQQCSE